MAKTLAQLEADVRRMLNAPTTDFYTQQDIYSTLNDGLTVVTEAAELLEATTSFNTVASQEFYNMPADALKVTLARYNVTRPLVISSRRFIQERIDINVDRTGIPQYLYIDRQPQVTNSSGTYTAPFRIGLYPVPSSGSVVVNYSYIQNHPTLSNPNDVSLIKSTEETAVVLYAASLLKYKEREFNEAKQMWDHCNRMIAQIKAEANSDPGRILEMEPDWLPSTTYRFAQLPPEFQQP